MSDKTVLLVDDEQNILDAMLRCFHREHLTFLTAQGADKGMQVLDSNPVQVVISDINMPGMSGMEFLSLVKKKYPDTVRVILSGQSDLSVVVDAINKGEVYRYLDKPIHKEELLSTIYQCFEHYSMKSQIHELTRKTIEQNKELTRLNEQMKELNAVQSRTLDLSKEILERLPVAVIGVTNDREIALANDAAKRIIPSLRLVSSGSDISDILPNDILQAVLSSMADACPIDSVRFLWDRKLIRATIEPLHDNGESRGCIIAFETQEIG